MTCLTIPFAYLDAFCKNEHFARFLPEYASLEELKAHYRRGGLGDVKIKLFLNNILQELLAPIREKRKKLEQNVDEIYEILFENSKRASEVAKGTLAKMKDVMGLDYYKLLKK